MHQNRFIGNFLRSRVSPLYALLMVQALLYSIFPTHSYHWDGVQFSHYIEGVHGNTIPATTLIHPNHLLYNVVNYGLYSWITTLGFAGRALYVLQSLNIAMSTLASYVFFRLAQRFTGSAQIALGCSVLFAFGALWWKYSTDGDSYILTILFMLLATVAAFAQPQRLLLTGVFHILAMLFHELAVFFYLPVTALVLAERDNPRPQRTKILALYLAATGSCTGAIYFESYRYSGHAANLSFLGWISSYASDSRFVQSPWEIIGSNMASYSKLFVGGKLSFLRDYFSVPSAFALVVLVVCLVFTIFFWRRPVRETNAATAPSSATPFLLAWVAPYFVFLACFEPGNPIHKVFVWPPIVLLIGIYIAHKQYLRARQRAFVACAAGLAAWNFAAFAYPHSHDTADPVVSLAKQIDRQLPRHATVYYRYWSPDDWYLQYLGPGRDWRPLPMKEGKPYLILDTSANALTCLETTALEALPVATDPGRRWDLVNSQHNIRFECLKPDH